jgi:hypothetical protein
MLNIDDIIEYTVNTHLLDDSSSNGKDSAISPDAFLAHMSGHTASSGLPPGYIRQALAAKQGQAQNRVRPSR